LRIEQVEESSRRLTNLSDRLYREVVSSRMRPFSDGVQAFPRLVRDLARSLAKKVKFDVVGKSTPVDRDILEKLEAPLNHILRNALDHGMEIPNARAQAGKPLEGSLKLQARHRAGMLLIEVTDDGPGIDLDRVRNKIIDKKLSTPELVAKMSEAELLDFLFLPGFSTAEKVTEVSGRGVGLNVVQTMVHEAGGTVRVFSQLGKGTTFQLQLPITRSVIRALLVKIAGQPYAFQLARIDRALKIPWKDLQSIENRLFFPMDGHNVGLVSAQEVLGLKGASAPAPETAIVVVSDHANHYGLAVDEFLGERDLVVRPLDARLGDVPDISSASLMEDGTPLLIIDVEDIVRSIDSMLGEGGLKYSERFHQTQEPKRKKRVLVVDDSVTVREVERKLLENHGYEVDVAVDGREGWNAVRLGRYDLVISDVDMPRMNGIEFVRLIKQDARLKSLPVMIVSYKDREEDRLRGLEAGANYYFAKSSFHDATMIHAVQDLIGAAEA
jgi:two-component system sensor histidine kinase and response regulator WspE